MPWQNMGNFLVDSADLILYEPILLASTCAGQGFGVLGTRQRRAR